VLPHQVAFTGEVALAVSLPRPRAAGAHAALVGCPRVRAPRVLDQCLACRYFKTVGRDDAHPAARLSCTCSDRDPVIDAADVRAAWPTVRPFAPAARAHRQAIEEDAPVLLVTRDEAVLGVVYRDQLHDGAGPVAARLVEYPWALSTRATLGDAVEALSLLGTPALLVLTDDGELAGVVSPAQLLLLGVPASLLPERTP
jgi:hypothetical protein